ncbi:MAG: hypothetical protein L0027_17205 [Candidatus Rokubacteria bacterium]|nr:hypothetical protein [Candidatus Rokubacteria bacterium]
MAGVISRADHDRVVRFVAATRFPFPGQADWPADNVTLTNETERRRAIATPEGPHYPDIVVVSAAGEIREVAEVETAVGPEIARVWAWASAAADTRTRTGVRHFFVYVPAGLEAEARRLLEAGQISYAGLRAYEVDGARIRIRPVVTLGDPKDHVESLGTA